MRVLSWNIHKGIGGRDRRYVLDRIVSVIRAEDPDVVCLQEVDQGVPRSKLDDQPVVLRERLGLPHGVYQRNVAVKQGGYGNLVLSRLPLADHRSMNLRLKWRKPRGAQLCVVETDAGPFVLVNWHLGLAEVERRWQVAQLLASEELATLEALPALVVGDFNDWRDQLHKVCFAEAGFAQVTTPASAFRSFPAYMPMGALDKAFVRGGLLVTGARVVKTAETRDASDHLPLVVDFEIGPAPDC